MYQQVVSNPNESSIICQFSNCYKIFEKPITFTCCGKSICEKHLEYLFSNDGRTRAKCYFCREEINLPKKGFVVNEAMDQITNVNLGKRHKQAKELANIFGEKLTFFDVLKGYPNNYINNYFGSIKEDVQKKRSEMKNMIDMIYDSIIVEIDSYEANTKSELDPNSLKTEDSLIDLKQKHSNWENEINHTIIDEVRWEKLNKEIADYTEELDFRTDILKTKILGHKSYNFEIDLSELDANSFGKVVVSSELYSTNVKTYDLISCSKDKSIKTWNIENDDCVHTFLEHSAAVFCVKLLSNDKIISCSRDGLIILWDMNTTSKIKTFGLPHIVPIYLIKLADNEFIVGAKNGDILIWNINENKPRVTLVGHTDTIFSLELFRGDKLISCSYDKTIKIWDLKTNECKYTLTGHTNAVTFLKLLPNGKLATCSLDKTIRIWDLQKYTCLAVLSGHEKEVYALELLENNKLASGGTDKMIKIWDLQTNSCIKTINAHNDRVNSLKCLSSSLLISCSEDRTIKIWNLNSYECTKILKGHQSGVCLLEAFSSYIF